MESNDQFFKAFLQRLVVKKFSKDLQEDEDQQKYKFLNLNSTIKEEKKKTVKKKKQMTSKNRKSLKLLSFSEDEKKYNLYLPLHQLWQDYMKSLLEGCQSNNQETGRRIMKADLHGCSIRVIRSKCPSLVGMEGIILLETKNIFTIITPSNEIKKVPKQNTVFDFDIEEQRVTLYGNNFKFKASERSTRNFKTKPTVDL